MLTVGTLTHWKVAVDNFIMAAVVEMTIILLQNMLVKIDVSILVVQQHWHLNRFREVVHSLYTHNYIELKCQLFWVCFFFFCNFQTNVSWIMIVEIAVNRYLNFSMIKMMVCANSSCIAVVVVMKTDLIPNKIVTINVTKRKVINKKKTHVFNPIRNILKMYTFSFRSVRAS